MLPVAHAGHWALDVLYVAPILIVILVIVTNVVRDRRAARDEEGREPPSGAE
jgi:hypothetical protein